MVLLGLWESRKTIMTTWKDGRHDIGVPQTWTSMNRTVRLLYVRIPKAASTSLTAGMGRNQTRRVIADAAKYHVFTVIRDPLERIVSAYSTVVSRGGAFGMCGRIQMQTLRGPNSTSIDAWQRHFVASLELWVTEIARRGWTSCRWNEHLVPQVEYMKGWPIKEIVCMESLGNFVRTWSIPPSIHNTYERDAMMPKTKFTQTALVPNETRAMVRKLYAVDYEMRGLFC